MHKCVLNFHNPFQADCFVVRTAFVLFYFVLVFFSFFNYTEKLSYLLFIVVILSSLLLMIWNLFGQLFRENLCFFPFKHITIHLPSFFYAYIIPGLFLFYPFGFFFLSYWIQLRKREESFGCCCCWINFLYKLLFVFIEFDIARLDIIPCFVVCHLKIWKCTTKEYSD